jgi:hypothetical protein
MGPISSNIPSVSVPSATSSGLATIASGSRQLAQDAVQIANPANPFPTTAVADLAQSGLLAQAGADVIRTSNAMLGSLFDALA